MVGSKVLIVIPRKPEAKSQFDVWWDPLIKGDNTGVVKPIGQSPARNRNIGIQLALDNDFTHILFVDDDVLLPRDTLVRLLAHDKDIVSGLYLMRSYPHQAIAFCYQDEHGKGLWQQLKPGMQGLIEIASGGLGCCLIKTSVFKALEAPWIRLGEIELDHWCDDTGFFLRAAKAGFKMYLDLDVQCGHIAEVSMWPKYENGKWISVYQTVSDSGSASIPQFYQTEDDLRFVNS